MSALARPRGLLGLAAGFLAWSSAFLVLYGLHALGCAWGWDAREAGPASLLRLVLVGAWIAHLALLCGLVALSRRLGRDAGAGDAPRLLARATMALTLAALVATLWTGLPVVAYPLCR